ncbi:hypothetical protein [Cellulomonas sp. PSBB021]|uniref:hypothetical protein n=1 Tax=Cellulomonas sp. PSBB021 TaxID=2003551 RepID=UPI0012FD6337|nr:hypothetical protein [Cellulomonas sp. PSBB021]
MSTLRAWLGVHHTRLAMSVLLATLVASALCRSSIVERVGGQQLASPVALVLLIPAVAAVGVAVGCVSPSFPRPNPVRARIARGAWALALIALAFVACVAGPASGGTAGASTTAILRNVAVYAVLALAPLFVRMPTFAWLPPTVYALAAIQFGSQVDGTVAVWAMVVDPSGTSTQLAVALTALSITVAGYAMSQREALPSRTRGLPSHAASSFPVD